MARFNSQNLQPSPTSNIGQFILSWKRKRTMSKRGRELRYERTFSIFLYTSTSFEFSFILDFDNATKSTKQLAALMRSKKPATGSTSLFLLMIDATTGKANDIIKTRINTR